MTVPLISPLFDNLPEKLVQENIFKFCNPLTTRREVPYDRYFADLVSDRYIIEVKRCSQASKSVGVHQPMGQVLYYSQAHRIVYGEQLTPVIMIYGLDYNKYLDPLFTQIRESFGVELWLLVSIKQGLIYDPRDGEVKKLVDLLNTNLV